MTRWLGVALLPRADHLRNAIRVQREVAGDAAFTEGERASYARYGYRYTGEAYAPHITLGCTDEDAAQELVRVAGERSSVPGSWIFDRLSFYVMGEHGAHAQTLVERELKRP